MNTELAFSLFVGFLATVLWFLVSWGSFTEAEIAEWKHTLLALIIGACAVVFTLWCSWFIQ